MLGPELEDRWHEITKFGDQVRSWLVEKSDGSTSVFYASVSDDLLPNAR